MNAAPLLPPIAPLAQPAPPAGAGGRPPPPAGLGHTCTFAELYANPTANVHRGTYEAVLTTFTAKPMAACLALANIQATLDNAGNGFLQVYLFLSHDDQAITVHTVTHYPVVLGIATPWDGD